MTYKYYIHKFVWLVGILLFCAISIVPATQAATVINNVSVESSSSNGDDQSSSISVKTVVDGKVVEDYQETSATGKPFYSSQIPSRLNFLNNKMRLELIVFQHG